MKITEKEIRPDYYKSENSIELIELIRDMPFALGNAIKYIYRCRNKESRVKDLTKALWYIEDHKNNSSQCNISNIKNYSGFSAEEMDAILKLSDDFERKTIYRIYREWLTDGDFSEVSHLLVEETKTQISS